MSNYQKVTPESSYEATPVRLLREQVSKMVLSFGKYEQLDSEEEKTLWTPIQSLSSKAFIRTHAFISSWIQEYVDTGVLEQKTLQQIVTSFPWGWDQTKKYLDFLEEEQIILFARDASRRKICRLNLAGEQKQAGKGVFPSELKRLLRFHSRGFRRDVFSSEKLLQVLRVFHNCFFRKKQLITIEREFNSKQKTIRLATKNEKAAFIEELVTAYRFAHDDDESMDPTLRIVDVLKKNPLMLKSLKKCGR